MQALRTLESMFDRAQTIQFAGSDHYFLGLAHYEILATHQDPRADTMLGQLHRRLQTEAARIKERSQRDNFLTRIPEHRELMALWQASRS